MNTLDESLPITDRTYASLFYEATTTGDWSLVEHFMLGTPGSSLRTDEKTGV